jgi:hypothetical protein
MALSRKLLAGFTGLALLGCGNLADEQSSPPPIATMTGTLTLADGTEVPDAQIRMALFWNTEESSNHSDSFIEGCGYGEAFLTYATQDIALDSTFPNQFTLNITEPPPAEALLARVEGGERISAEAHIIVYADGNENGALDVRPEGGASPDQVLGTSYPPRESAAVEMQPQEIEVLYFAKDYDDEYITASAGFSLQFYPGAEGGTVQLMPIDTPIDLTLTGASYLQDILCEQFCRSRDFAFECPANPGDLPQRPEGTPAIAAGNTGGTAYTWTESDGEVTFHTACGGGGYVWNRKTCRDCSCIDEGCRYEEGSVAPEQWPCD